MKERIYQWLVAMGVHPVAAAVIAAAIVAGLLALGLTGCAGGDLAVTVAPPVAKPSVSSSSSPASPPSPVAPPPSATGS